MLAEEVFCRRISQQEILLFVGLRKKQIGGLIDMILLSLLFTEGEVQTSVLLGHLKSCILLIVPAICRPVLAEFVKVLLQILIDVEAWKADI